MDRREEQISAIFVLEEVFAINETDSLKKRPDQIDRINAMEMIIAALTSCVSIHHGHMPEIEILGPTSARGICAMEDNLYWQTSEPTHGIASLRGYGHYHETYTRPNGHWVYRLCV